MTKAWKCKKVKGELEPPTKEPREGPLEVASMKLKKLCNSIMNMDSRVRFVGVLDNKNTRLIEGDMRKSILPLLPAHKNDSLLFTHSISPSRTKGF